MDLSDQRQFEAAQGWLELGDAASAARELSHLSAEAHGRIEVLMLRWEIHARQKEWESALAVVAQALPLAADQPAPWIQRSFALHELRRTSEALEGLLPAAERFPDNTTIAYNLACYCCQLNRHHEALEWLGKAMKASGHTADLKQMALADPDLAPLKGEIEARW